MFMSDMSISVFLSALVIVALLLIYRMFKGEDKE
jgi:hypothetical protein